MRLDNFLTEKGYFDSRTKAKQSIERGEIFVNGKLTNKPALDVDENVIVKRVVETEYVSLGGFKLQKALLDFNFNVKDLIVADIGSSTGGFTDCLLKNGAKQVYSIDLRDDLLHEKIKSNHKVFPIIKNAKELNLSDFDKKLDLIVGDLSFISLTQVLPVFYNLIDDYKKLILLIKPQFETGQRRKFKNGIIRDKKIHKEVCEKIYHQAIAAGLAPKKITSAPLSNDKNTEFLIFLEKGGDPIDLSTFIESL